MVVKMVVRPIAKLCEQLDHVEAVNLHGASKGVDHCSNGAPRPTSQPSMSILLSSCDR